MERVIENCISLCDRGIAYANSLFTKFSDLVFRKNKITLIASVLLVLIMVVVMYLLNHHTTLIVDDFAYSFNAKGQRVGSVEEIVVRMWRHYFDWGGRVVVHFIAMVFLWVGKPIFNVFNTLAFIALVVIMYYLAVGTWPFARKQNYPMILLGIFFMFFAFVPVFGQDFLWLVGASNYLWGMLIFLLMLVPFRAQVFSGENKFKNPLWLPVFFFGNVLAGWTNENIGVTLVAMILFCMIAYWQENHKVHGWMICALLGAVIGAMLLVLAPGNFVRFHTEGGGHTLHIFDNFLNVTRIIFQPDLTLIPLCLALGLRVLTEKVKDYKKDMIFYLFLFGMLASAYSMVASPSFTERARLGPLVLSVICCLSLYPYLDVGKVQTRKILCIAALILFTLLGSNVRRGYTDIVSYEKCDKAKVEYALKEKAKGNQDIILLRNYPSTRYCAAYGLEDIDIDPKYWTNEGFAHYYGVKQVRVLDNQNYK